MIQTLSDDEKEAIHRFARVSMVGASTRIENAVLTDAEIQWIDTTLTKDGHPVAFDRHRELIENKLSKDKERSIEEVSGCRNMLFLIYEQYRDFFPLTESTIRALHAELLRYYSKAEHYLGAYKTVTNSVVQINHITGERRTVFKTADPGPITQIAMRELVEWYNKTLLEYPWTLAVASEFVFRFLAIHPFQDGNGRTGRGLFLLSLLQSSDKSLSYLTRYLAIDRQIERHREEYYLTLQRCSGGVFKENPKEYKIELFFKFMLKVLEDSLNDIDVYRKKYTLIKNLSPAATEVLNCFKEFPEKKLTTAEVIKTIKLPRRTVNNALSLLTKSQLIQKYGQGAGTRYQIVF